MGERAKRHPFTAFRPGKCPKNSDTNKVNAQNVRKGAQEALNAYIESHPEMATKELKYNPLDHVKPKQWCCHII